MADRPLSRRARASLSTLASLARLRAQALEHRLAPEQARIATIRAQISQLADRRKTLIASQSGSVAEGASDHTGNAALDAYILASAEALRLEQAALYRDLARAEAATEPLRTETGRAHARVMVLERLASR